MTRKPPLVASLQGDDMAIRVQIPAPLRSLTGGRGRFTATHSHYDPAPPNLADKIVAEAAAAREG